MSREAEPAKGEPVSAFEVHMRVRFHEVDVLGHVNNAAYLNYIEQAAIDHATRLGLDLERLRALGGVFVAARHDIRFLRPAYAGDVLRIVTWLEPPQGARVNRHYRIYREQDPPETIFTVGRDVEANAEGDSTLAVQASTEWVFVSEQGRPRRIPAEILDAFNGSALEAVAGSASPEQSGC